MAGEAVGGGVVEQVGVLPDEGQAAIVVGNADHVEVGFRSAVANAEDQAGPQPGPAFGRARRVVEGKERLDQGRAARVAAWPDGLDHRVERGVRAGVCVERNLAHPLDQLAHRRVAAQVAAEGDGVDDHPDQPLGVRIAPVCDPRADL